MITFYLVCLIIGGGFLGYSLFSGDDGDDAGHNGDMSHDISDHPNDLHHDSTDADSLKYFSFRNFVYFTAFFGLTGSALSFAGMTTIATLVSSIFVGGFSSAVSHKLMSYLKKNESGDVVTLSGYVGCSGVVSVGIRRGGRGKIIVEKQGHTSELIASLAESSNFEMIDPKKRVIILEILDNTAIVVEYE